MAPVPIPNGILAFENYHSTVIQDNNWPVFAVLTKNRDGCVVFNARGVLWEATGQDFGAPDLNWRQSDGACILTSMMQGGRVMYFERVPGVYKDGRLP
jgi:hypothetical protein